MTGGAESGADVVQNTVQSEADTNAPEPTRPPETLTVEGFRRLVSDSDIYSINEYMGRVGVEPTSNAL